MSDEELKAELERLRKENEALKKGASTGIQIQRWSRFAGQNGGLAKVDFGFDYAANFSSFACVA